MKHLILIVLRMWPCLSQCKYVIPTHPHSKLLDQIKHEYDKIEGFASNEMHGQALNSIKCIGVDTGYLFIWRDGNNLAQRKDNLKKAKQ